jgi:hypothetical protein
MPKFLIEVAEDSESVASKRVDDAVRMVGSHFVTHAQWEWKNGVRIGSMIAELDNKSVALGIVPPNMRSQARVTNLVAGASS